MSIDRKECGPLEILVCTFASGSQMLAMGLLVRYTVLHRQALSSHEEGFFKDSVIGGDKGEPTKWNAWTIERAWGSHILFIFDST